MNAIKITILLIFSTVSVCFSERYKEEEPACTSRYDFESKLLQNMLKVEFEMSVLKERYRADMNELKADTQTALENLKTLSSQLESDTSVKLNEMALLEKNLSLNVEEKIEELETTKRLQEEDFANLYKDMELKSNKKLDEIRDEALKPTVAFVAKNLHTTNPGADTVLRFTEIIINTDDVYNLATGYFTAPVDGTYFFAVQLCPYNNKYVHVKIFANEIMLNNAILFETTGFPCSSLTAIATLSSGSRAYVQHGTAYSGGTVIYQDETNRWATFMGSLVN